MRSLLAVSFVVSALAASSSALAEPLFFVEGRGWGHGIGLAQYGARGYALREGRSYDWILAHYFRGTTLASAPPRVVRVLLADGAASLTLGSDAPFRVTDAKGRKYRLPAGSLRLGPELRVATGGASRVLASPLRFSRGERPLELRGRPYRGELVVRSGGRTLSAVNHVGLEEYLYGVVPDEMPPSWPPEALKAQAVAARSYALAGRRSNGIFELFADTRSQVYGGLAAEEPRASAAVAATAGKVLLHDGRVAHTFFHSSSGGRTAAIRDVWPAAQDLGYLVSVRDPYDRLSPYHRWGPLRYTARDLARRLGSSSLLDLRVARNASGRAAAVLAERPRGVSRIAGTTFQAKLGLRSSWFSVSVLSLRAPGRLELGKTTVLRGLARGFRVVSLERKRWGGDWVRVKELRRSADGSFAVPAAPSITTWYRLSSPKGKGLPERVSVAALVRFTKLGARGLEGLVRPKLAGTTVTVQRYENGRWVTVGRARTSEAGVFRASFTVTPGSYRALASVGPGYATGTTPVLSVVRE